MIDIKHDQLIMASNSPTGVKRDKDGYYWVTGRTDDLLNVSGHLLSTAEVEAAMVEHESIAETAAVSTYHSLKGECIYCYIVLKEGKRYSKELEFDLKQQGEYWIVFGLKSQD